VPLPEGARSVNVLPSSRSPHRLYSRYVPREVFLVFKLATGPQSSFLNRLRPGLALRRHRPSSFLDVDDGANGPSGELKVQEVGEGELQPQRLSRGFRALQV
jgi:hypothetical protein